MSVWLKLEKVLLMVNADIGTGFEGAYVCVPYKALESIGRGGEPVLSLVHLLM